MAWIFNRFARFPKILHFMLTACSHAVSRLSFVSPHFTPTATEILDIPSLFLLSRAIPTTLLLNSSKLTLSFGFAYPIDDSLTKI